MYKIDENATLDNIKNRLSDIMDSVRKSSNLAEMLEITTNLNELVNDYAMVNGLIKQDDPVISFKCLLLNGMFEDVVKCISTKTTLLYLEGLEG